MTELTTVRIENAAPGTVLRDTRVAGLHCRIGARRRSFYLHYRTRGGRQRRPKLGDASVLSIARARSIARELLSQVAAGGDPAADWKRARGEMTVTELFDAVWNAHWSKPRYQQSGHARDVRYKWTNHLAPVFGSCRLSEVTPGTVRAWHAELEATPLAANRALEILSRLFAFAEEAEWRAPGTNPCRLVRSYREPKRRRYATEQEIRTIGRILSRDFETHPGPVAFLLLLMFTGSRPRAIEQATLDQVQRIESENGTYGVLAFHGKSSAETGEDERVLLPPAAMRVIDAVPRNEGDRRLVGTNAPRRYWERIRQEANCPDLWMRDLRRTFATIGMSMGKGMDTIGELLNHRSTQTTKVYALLGDTARVDTATGIAERVERLISDPGR